MNMRIQVEDLISKGLSYRNISKTLGISRSTAFYHASAENRTYARRKRKLNKAKFLQSLRDMLGGRCCKCGYDKYQGALHFHHINPKMKVDQVPRLVENGTQNEALLEAKKCELVCANCHVELHFS